MRIVTVGKSSFVSGFRLAGVEGVEVEDSQQAMGVISKLFEEQDLGLLLVSDDVTRPLTQELTRLRSKKPVPLLYEVPAPGSRQEKVEYRDMLKQILGV